MKLWLCCLAGLLACVLGCDPGSNSSRIEGSRDAASIAARDAHPARASELDASRQGWRSRAIAVSDAVFRDAARSDDAGRAAATSDAGAGQQPAPAEAGPASPPKPPVNFDPPGGGFSSTLSLNLTPGKPEALIHYTLDGSLPTESSSVASGPITLDKTRVVRAIAIEAGIQSAVFNQTYFQLDDSLKDFDGNLPLVVVHMLGGAAPSPSVDSYLPATLGVFADDGERSRLDRTATHTSRLGIRIRGRSTRYQAKPSYTLELWGRDEEDAPAPLLGMPEDGDWVLYAPFDADRTLLHNVFAYGLSNQIGRYAPRTRYCEVFMVSGSEKVTRSHYVGVYVLTERLTRDHDRIAIEKLTPADTAEPALSGGYIVKIDAVEEPEEAFEAGGEQFIYVDPKPDEIAPEQTEYIASYLDAIEHAVEAADGKDPRPGPYEGKHYSELIDVGSFIDHHILNLLLKNPDAFALSAYFYKDRGGKLNAGPLWDFDLAMSARDPFGDRSKNPHHWGPGEGSSAFTRGFYGPLFDHSDFASAYWARWRELLAGPFSAAAFRARVDEIVAPLSEAEARNRARWPQSTPRDDSYSAEIAAQQEWLDERLGWISEHLDVLP